MKIYIRHYHKISQSPHSDTTLATYDGPWDLESVWSWAQSQGYPAGGRSTRALPRVERDVFVYFLTGPYHSVVIGPVDGPSAKIHNGKPERSAPRVFIG